MTNLYYAFMFKNNRRVVFSFDSAQERNAFIRKNRYKCWRYRGSN
jgi:hypothetical protein